MVRYFREAKKKSVFTCVILLTGIFVFSITSAYAETKIGSEGSGGFYNPFKRLKPGPPLKNVTHKADSAWIYDWIRNPKSYNLNIRMPYLMLEDDEVKSVMAYLASIADEDFPPKIQWDAYLTKPKEELTDEENERVDILVSAGRKVWKDAHCNICHAQKGIGGLLKVAPDLGRLRSKINNRDWLYFWIKNPRDYFPNTLMVQFGLTDEELRSLIEYILRSGDFMLEEEVGEELKVEISYSNDPAIIKEGKRTITISRCVICHDIEGIKEVLPVAKKESAPTKGFAKLVYEKRCLTCHNISGEGGTSASPWDYEGSKLKESGISNILENPDIIGSLLQPRGRCPLTF